MIDIVGFSLGKNFCNYFVNGITKRDGIKFLDIRCLTSIGYGGNSSDFCNLKNFLSINEVLHHIAYNISNDICGLQNFIVNLTKKVWIMVGQIFRR